MKNFNELREARQMKDPKKDSMVQKGGKTIVVDKSKEKEYLKKGWSLAESVNLDEGKMKDFHGYIDQGKSAQWIAKKMGLDMKTVKALMDDIKESTDLSEAADFEKISNDLLKHKKKGIEFEKAAAFARVMFMNSSLSVQDKAFMGLTKMLKDMDDFTKKTTITKILKDNGFKVRGGKLMRESLEEDKDKFVVKYAMSKKGPIRTMPFNLLIYAKKFLADKEKEGYKGIISKGGKPVKESFELDEQSMTDNDWVVVARGRKPVRFLKNPKNNKAPSNWQKSSDEQEVIRVSKAKQMGIIKKESVELDEATDVAESVDHIVENYRTLAKHGMGAETKNSINVGRGVDYYQADGAKYMGKVTRITKTGYVVKDEKDGKSRSFAFYDRAKAKELLAK